MHILSNPAISSNQQSPQAAASTPPPELVVQRTRPDRIIFRGVEIQVRPTEFNLVSFLAWQPGVVVSYQAIMDTIYGPDERVSGNQVNWHNRRLVRKLIAAVPSAQSPITTVPRFGLMLNLPADSVAMQQ